MAPGSCALASAMRHSTSFPWASPSYSMTPDTPPTMPSFRGSILCLFMSSLALSVVPTPYIFGSCSGSSCTLAPSNVTSILVSLSLHQSRMIWPMGLTADMGMGISDMITMISLHSSSGAHSLFPPKTLTGGEGTPSIITAVGMKLEAEKVPMRSSPRERTI